MELNVVALVALSIFVAFLLAPSACLRTDVIPSPSTLYHGSRKADVQPSPRLPTAPRKLKLAEVDDKTRSAAALASNHDEGKLKEEEAMSDFMAMDYSHSKKRCPSHNQSPPASP